MKKNNNARRHDGGGGRDSVPVRWSNRDPSDQRLRMISSEIVSWKFFGCSRFAKWKLCVFVVEKKNPKHKTLRPSLPWSWLFSDISTSKSVWRLWFRCSSPTITICMYWRVHFIHLFLLLRVGIFAKHVLTYATAAINSSSAVVSCKNVYLWCYKKLHCWTGDSFHKHLINIKNPHHKNLWERAVVKNDNTFHFNLRFLCHKKKKESSPSGQS